MLTMTGSTIYNDGIVLGDLSTLNVMNDFLYYTNVNGAMGCIHSDLWVDDVLTIVNAWKILYPNGKAAGMVLSFIDYQNNALQKISDDSEVAMNAGFNSTINSKEVDVNGNPKSRMFEFQPGDQANWAGGAALIDYVLDMGIDNIPDVPMKAQLVIQPAIPAVMAADGITILHPAIPAQLIGLNAKSQGGQYEVFTIQQYKNLVFLDAASHKVMVLGKAAQLRGAVSAATTIAAIDQIMTQNIWEGVL